MRMALTGLLLLSACGGAAEAGPVAERSVALRSFSAVDLAGPDRVDIVTGRDFAIRARGDAAVLDRLTFAVSGTTLRIARKPNQGWSWRDRTAVIRVMLPALKGATLSGSGDLSVDRATDLTAQLTGSGDMTIAQLSGRTAELGLRGSGTIAAAGRVDRLALALTGSGSATLGQKARCTIRKAGSGEAHCGG